MNTKIMLTAFVAAFASAGAVLAAPTSTTYNCTGSVGAVTISKNVVVPSGRSCRLNGTVITGNVTVRSNAKLDVQGGALIGGDLIGQAAANISFVDSTVGGNFQVDDLGSVNSSADHCLTVGASTIAGDLLIDSVEASLDDDDHDNHHGSCGHQAPPAPQPEVVCLELDSNFIGGSLVVQNASAEGGDDDGDGHHHQHGYGHHRHGNGHGYGHDNDDNDDSGIRFLITTNDIGGDFSFQQNEIESSLTDNTTGGNFNFLCNDGQGELLRNTVNGDLNYQSSAPVPTVEDNTVFGSTNLVDCI